MSFDIYDFQVLHVFAEHEGKTVTIYCNIYTTLSILPFFAFAVQSFNPKTILWIKQQDSSNGGG